MYDEEGVAELPTTGGGGKGGGGGGGGGAKPTGRAGRGGGAPEGRADGGRRTVARVRRDFRGGAHGRAHGRARGRAHGRAHLVGGGNSAGVPGGSGRGLDRGIIGPRSSIVLEGGCLYQNRSGSHGSTEKMENGGPLLAPLQHATGVHRAHFRVYLNFKWLSAVKSCASKQWHETMAAYLNWTLLQTPPRAPGRPISFKNKKIESWARGLDLALSRSWYLHLHLRVYL